MLQQQQQQQQQQHDVVVVISSSSSSSEDDDDGTNNNEKEKKRLSSTLSSDDARNKKKQTMGDVDASTSGFAEDSHERNEKRKEATVSAERLNERLNKDGFYLFTSKIGKDGEMTELEEAERETLVQIEDEVGVIDENDDVSDEDEDEDGEFVVEFPKEAMPKGARKTAPEAVSPAALGGKEGLKVFDAAFKYPKVFGKKISDEMIEEDFFRETDTKPIFDAEEHGKVSLFVYELNRSFGTIVGRGSVLQTVNDEVLETIRDEIKRGETVVAVKVPVCVQQLVPEGKSLCRNRAGGAAYAGSTAQGLEAMYRTFIDTLGGTRNTTTNATKLIVLSINMFSDASAKRRQRDKEAKDRLEVKEHYESLKGANPTFCDLNASQTAYCLRIMYEIFAAITEEVRRYVSMFSFAIATAKGAKALYDAVVNTHDVLPCQFEETFPLWRYAFHPSTLGRNFCMWNFARWLMAMLKRFVPGFAVDDDGGYSRVQTFSGNRGVSAPPSVSRPSLQHRAVFGTMMRSSSSIGDASGMMMTSENRSPAQFSSRVETFTVPSKIIVTKVTKLPIYTRGYKQLRDKYPKPFECLCKLLRWWLYAKQQQEEEEEERAFGEQHIALCITESDKDLAELHEVINGGGAYSNLSKDLKKNACIGIPLSGARRTSGLGANRILSMVMNKSIVLTHLDGDCTFDSKEGFTVDNLQKVKQKCDPKDTPVNELPNDLFVGLGKNKKEVRMTLWFTPNSSKEREFWEAATKAQVEEALQNGILHESQYVTQPREKPKKARIQAEELSNDEVRELVISLEKIKGGSQDYINVKTTDWRNIVAASEILSRNNRSPEVVRTVFIEWINRSRAKEFKNENLDKVTKRFFLQEGKRLCTREKWTQDQEAELIERTKEWEENYTKGNGDKHRKWVTIYHQLFISDTFRVERSSENIRQKFNKELRYRLR